MTPFGPQLIGETEKTLNALLDRILEGTGLSEPEWVTLRVAGTSDDPAADLATEVARRAHFTGAPALVAGLTDRGLLADDQLTDDATALIATVQQRIAAETSALWRDLPDEDVQATARVLNEVAARARTVLGCYNSVA